MSHVEREITTQPACWRRAARLAVPEAAALPARGELVAVVGCGTSLFMAQAYAVLRESLGLGLTDAFPASEMPKARHYDRVLAISRSGTTTEVLDALHGLPANRPTTVISADARTPVPAAAQDVICLDFADERSIVQTRFATSTLMLLRAHAAWQSTGDESTALAEMDAVAADAELALAAPMPADSAALRQVTFLGSGWTVGLAAEAALKLREAAQAWTESYPAMEYRHGPISVTGPGTLVWMFDATSAALADEVRRAGGTPVLPELDPLAELVRAQRLAVALAAHRGLDPDHPRHLSRSVILATEQA